MRVRLSPSALKKEETTRTEMAVSFPFIQRPHIIQMKTISTLIGIILCSAALSGQPYKDPSLPVSQRVEDLLGRMTLEEKIQQMSMTGLGDIPGSGAGWGACDSPFIGVEEIASMSARAKQYAREQTRLGIPPIQIAECLHGLLSYGATIFPQAIAQGSTWNPELIEEMAAAIAEEASAAGVDQALSPLFDLIRDPRYGRNEECYSEDPYLTGEMGKAFIRGMQGDPETTAGGIPEGKLMCTAKHFAAYSIPDAGVNLAPSSIGERELRSLHLYPFGQAVKEANAYAVMPSYSEIDGIPAHANRFLLTEILRDEWGFKGYVFSDYGGLSHLVNFHHTAATKGEAAMQALNAGVDLEAARPDIYPHLEELVKEGNVTEEEIDTAVRRILTAKFKAGLFEKPYPDARDIRKKVHTEEHIGLARRIAEESVILLKNDGGLLPLDPDKLESLAVIGPNADQVQYGDYSYTRDNSSGVTVLQGIRNYLGDKVDVRYAKGCPISGLDRSQIDEAVETARQCDATVVVLGGTSVILSGLGWGLGPGESEAGDPFTCGEGYDLTDIDPPGVQRELVQALVETGKPVILILVHGRPWSISWEKEHLPAILEAWYPGEQGGAAIADILFGEVNPSGRLNATVPPSVGHLPMTYDRKYSAKGINREPGTPEHPGRDYVFSSPDPLFPFGFGLSYTEFSYSDMQISGTQFGSGGVTLSVTVTNTGEREGKEVVQLYVSDKASSVTVPAIALKRFCKISLAPGESRRVSFQVSPEDLGLWNADMEYVTEPGEFEFSFRSSAEDILCSLTATYTGQ